MYKRQSQKYVLVKSYNISVGHYWLESEVLVIAQSPPKLGQLHVFFLSQKNFQGPVFTIDVSPSVTDKWTASFPGSRLLTHAYEAFPHAVCLAKIYSELLFVHLDAYRGKLKIYEISIDKVSLKDSSFDLPTGQSEIRVVDNLLIVQNYDLQESYIIDLHSNHQVVAHLWNGMKDQTSVSLKLRVLIEKPRIVIEPTFLYDGQPIRNNKRHPNFTEDGPVHTLDCPLPLDHNLMYIDDDTCIDIHRGRCYRLAVSPSTIVKSHPLRTESVLFLLRRKGHKLEALAETCECVRKRVDLKEISQMFFVMNKAYKQAVLERKKPNDHNYQLSPKKTSEKSFGDEVAMSPDIRNLFGMTIVLQSDMYSNVFEILYNEKDLVFLSYVMEEYYRALIMNDIQVHIGFQLMLARILIETKNTVRLHQFAQYLVFSDNIEIATLFMNLDYTPGVQIGIDILHRINAQEIVSEHLMQKEYVYETVKLLSVHKFPNFDIKKLLLVSEGLEDPQMDGHITQYIRQSSLT